MIPDHLDFYDIDGDRAHLAKPPTVVMWDEIEEVIGCHDLDIESVDDDSEAGYKLYVVGTTGRNRRLRLVLKPLDSGRWWCASAHRPPAGYRLRKHR